LKINLQKVAKVPYLTFFPSFKAISYLFFFYHLLLLLLLLSELINSPIISSGHIATFLFISKEKKTPCQLSFPFLDYFLKGEVTALMSFHFFIVYMLLILFITKLFYFKNNILF
jgi:hypothetical protein